MGRKLSSAVGEPKRGRYSDFLAGKGSVAEINVSWVSKEFTDREPMRSCGSEVGMGCHFWRRRIAEGLKPAGAPGRLGYLLTEYSY